MLLLTLTVLFNSVHFRKKYTFGFNAPGGLLLGGDCHITFTDVQIKLLISYQAFDLEDEIGMWLGKTLRHRLQLSLASVVIFVRVTSIPTSQNEPLAKVSC